MEIVSYIPQIYAEFSVFILILTRISTMLSMLVIFRRETITTRIVIALSTVLSLYVMLLYPEKTLNYDIFSIQMLVEAFLQAFIGFLSALIINIVFEIFVSVGQIISSQIGLSMASLIDQRFGYITSLTHFYVITATLIFLYLNGHLFAITTIVNSFNVLPINIAFNPSHLMMGIVNYASVIFSGAIMLSITIVIVLLLTNIAIAGMTKFAPQFNLFSIGINMELIIGLICIYLTFNLFATSGSNVIRDSIAFLQHAFTRLN